MQVSNVPRISPVQQVVADVRVETRRLASEKLAEKMPGERKNVLAPFAQRGRLKDIARDAVIKILSKGATFDLSQEIAVCGGHQTEVRFLPDIAAQALVSLLLDAAENLRLQRQRYIADLVEEQRCAIGERKGAVTSSVRAREGAPFMAEEFAAREFRRQRSAVDRSQFAARTR